MLENLKWVKNEWVKNERPETDKPSQEHMGTNHQNRLYGNIALIFWSFPLLLASSSEIHAQADAWANLQFVCKELRIPQIEQFIQEARAWEQKELATQSDLTNISHNVCPSYLQGANSATSIGVAQKAGSVTLQQYVIEQTRSFSNALTSDAKGKKGKEYLMAQFKDLLRASAKAKVNFANTLCGQYITNRVSFITSELTKIANKTLEVKTTCLALAKNISDQGQQKHNAALPSSAGSAPTRAPAGASKPRESTITGTITPEPKRY